MADKTRLQFNKSPGEILQERKARREMNSQQAQQQAKMASIKEQRQPLGGAPPVKIPPLNADPVPGGGTMEQQAAILQDATSPLSPNYNPQLALMMQQQQAQQAQLTPDQMAAMAQQRGLLPHQQPVGGPFSTLPPQAQKDPNFRPGMGSMIAANQPAIDPQLKQPKTVSDGYRPILSPETQASMQALAAFQEQAEKEQQKAAQTPHSQAKEAETDINDELRNLQDEMLSSVGYEEWNKLNNPERRKLIEARLEPMKVTDIIIHGEIRQDVIILPKPNEIVATYRSVSGAEDLAIKQMMGEESGGDRYMIDKYTMMQLVLGLTAINHQELPAHLDQNGNFSEELFLKKFERAMKYPMQFLADLGVQYLWFDDRVRDLLVGQTEALKNT